MSGSQLSRRIFAALLAFGALAGSASAEEKAKNLFGAEKLPAAADPRSYGFYSKGCLAGAVAIPADGPTWQAMRLSRNRRWGHPAMISLIERFSRDAKKDGWPGLLLGDIAQPRGGPMLDGHASHQIGLDADIWFTPMPKDRLSAQARETVEAVTLVNPDTHRVIDSRWSKADEKLLKRAASYDEVERIFVNPAIKKKLCDTVTGDRSWLAKIRPIWGHDYHFHVRIKCQPDSFGCKEQEPIRAEDGDGCGKPLAWWFTEEPWRPNKNPDAPKARDLMTMKDLPKACQAVLAAPPVRSEAAATLGATAYASANATVAAAPVLSSLAASAAFLSTPDLDAPVPVPRPSKR